MRSRFSVHGLLDLTMSVFFGGVNCISVGCRKMYNRKIKYFTGFYTLFPACDILLALICGTWINQTWAGIHAHSHGCILSLWFSALYNLYDTICLFTFLSPLIICCAGMAVINGFYRPLWPRGRTGVSEDDNVKLDDSSVTLLSFVRVFEPSYSVAACDQLQVLHRHRPTAS